MNKELMGKIARAIESDPKRYDQETYGHMVPDCGTCFCIAGWAVHLEEPELIRWDSKGNVENALSVEKEATELLDLDDEETDVLFAPSWPSRFFVDEERPVSSTLNPVPYADDAVALLDWAVEHGRLPEPEDFE